MTKAADIYYKISPFSLAAIVMLNFLLIYLNLLNLENQSVILGDIAENTEIALNNQELGLNISNQNHVMLERIIQIQEHSNDSIPISVIQPPHLNNTNSNLFDRNFSPFFVVQNQSNNSNLSSNVGELQVEVTKLRNQLEPRNISEAFPLYPLSSINASNNTYAEQKEGSIAGLNFSKLR